MRVSPSLPDTNRDSEFGRKGSMEDRLLVKEESSNGGREVPEKWRGVAGEAKKVGGLAAPMVAVLLSEYLPELISTVMVGHLGELSLSSSAIAISIAGVTGFGVLMGLACGLETLAGQAYGAEQFERVGFYTYTAILSLILVCIPLSFLWMNVDKILLQLGQDASISYGAGRFSTCLIPAMFAYAALQPLVRYFQSQSMIAPLLIGSVGALCIHIPLCWVLVFKTTLANLGGAFSIGISIWINVLFLALYMRFSTACKKTRATPFSMEVLYGVREFFRFAIPSAVMTCLEWWSFELLILLSGLLSNPQLETSVLSVCLSTTTAFYTVPYGVGSAGSTRVSNELGAGNHIGARVAVYGVMTIVVSEGIVLSLALFAFRNLYGYLFSDTAEVVDYVTQMTPFICLSLLMDSLNGGIQGIARGCGLQKMGAIVNLAAYYLFGIPIAAVLGFWLQLKGKGLWLGILCGSALQAALLILVIAHVDWEKEATEARRRILEGDCRAIDEADEERLLGS